MRELLNGKEDNYYEMLKSLFTDLNAEYIDGIFSSKDADNIIYLIKEINNNARLSL